MCGHTDRHVELALCKCKLHKILRKAATMLSEDGKLLPLAREAAAPRDTAVHSLVKLTEGLMRASPADSLHIARNDMMGGLPEGGEAEAPHGMGRQGLHSSIPRALVEGRHGRASDVVGVWGRPIPHKRQQGRCECPLYLQSTSKNVKRRYMGLLLLWVLMTTAWLMKRPHGCVDSE